MDFLRVTKANSGILAGRGRNGKKMLLWLLIREYFEINPIHLTNQEFYPYMVFMRHKTDQRRAYQAEWARGKRARLRAAPEPVGGPPAGHRIRGLSTLVGADGELKLQWIKTTASLDPQETIDVIKAAFADYDPAPYRVVPPGPAEGSEPAEGLVLYPISDLHIGMRGWGQEVGTDWDLKIAIREITLAVEKLVNMTPPSAEAVLLGGGDAMHSDSNLNMTQKSHNVLQVDGRYSKILEATCLIFVHIADLILRKHNKITIRILQGNHDEHSSFALVYFLKAWYRNEPRVVVDTSPSLFWWREFGNTLLGATHGHTLKISQMAGIMAYRQAEAWGRTRHRFVHTFHKHHAEKQMSEGGGVITEVHQVPIPNDAYGAGAGFLSGRSLSAITYSKKDGEIARSRVVL